MTSDHFLFRHRYIGPIEITFFVPCYNEENNILFTIQTLERATKHFRDLRYEILIFDDASQDQTSESVLKYIQDHPTLPISLIRNQKNQGLGHNYFRGAKLALGNYYMLVNGDNDIHEDFIVKILSHRGKADLIIPYIVNQKDRSWTRQVISHLFTCCVSFLSGNRLRYYNGQVLHLRETILMSNVKTNSLSYQAELICEAIRRGHSYLEVSSVAQLGPNQKNNAFILKNFYLVGQALMRIFLYRLKSMMERILSPRCKISKT